MISNLGFCQVVLLHSFPKILNAAVWSWQSSCVYPFMPEKAKKWPQLPRLTPSYTELSSGPDKALRQRKTTMCFEKSTEYRSCFFLLKQIISKKWDFSLINMLLIMLMNSFKYILFYIYIIFKSTLMLSLLPKTCNCVCLVCGGKMTRKDAAVFTRSRVYVIV